MNFQALIQACEEDLHAGRASASANRLRQLHSVVRGEGPATPFEILEYAAALQKLGAVSEAIDLLQSLNAVQIPEVDLILAFCRLKRYEFAQAVPLLRRYIEFAAGEDAKAVGAKYLVQAESASVESPREADFQSLQEQFVETKFNHLMFGTPYPAYREHVARTLNHDLKIDSYRFGPDEVPTFNLSTGEFSGTEAQAPSKTVHQLLATLLKDFYRPWSIGSLFAELFPQERYDIFSSPNRVHQLLWRLRKWTEANRIPVELTESHGNYSLKISGPFAFIVSLEEIRIDENVLHLRQLQSRFKGRESFTPREAQECLNISASSFKRLAQWGLKEQKLRREGASRATIYKLVA